MGSLTNYGEDKLIGHLCGAEYSPTWSKLYLALCTSDPTDSATGESMNECTAQANGYSRKEISLGAASGRKVTQDADVTFDPATGAWGTITHWAIVDSASGAGNVYATGACNPTFSPVSGNTPTIQSTKVYIQIDAGGGAAGVGITTYAANKLLDLMFNKTAFSQPATYVALVDTAQTDASTTLNTDEIAGTDYARVLVNKAGGSSPAWDAVSGGATSNAAEVAFPTVGEGGWTALVGMCLVDSGTLTQGNVLAYDNANVVDQTPAATDTVKFAAGALDVSLS